MSQDYQTITLGIGEKRMIDFPGRVFACDTSTGNFGLRVDDNPEVTCSSKRIFGSSTSPVFKRVVINNTSGSSNVIVFAISLQDIQIEKQVTSVIANITVGAMKLATTTLAGTGLTALTSGSTATKTNANRKQFVVRCHSSSAGNLEIQDSAGNMIDVLLPGDPAWTLETNDTVKLKAVGGAVDYSFGETSYP